MKEFAGYFLQPTIIKVKWVVENEVYRPKLTLVQGHE